MTPARALSLCLLLVAACGTDGSSFTIAATPLAGTVFGQPWTFAAGETSAFLSEGEPEFFGTLYGAAYTACGFSTPDGPHLIASVPKEVGEYEFGLSLNMTFTDSSDNLVATDGVIRVDEVTATTVSGGLHGRFNGDNEVDGTFSLSICPSTAAN